MTDQELEVVAKTVGYSVHNWLDGKLYVVDPAGVKVGRADPFHWDPRRDDGDAFRLQVKLHLSVEVNEMSVQVECWQADTGEALVVHEPAYPLCDYSAVTRRAIFRAAVKLGSTSPQPPVMPS